MDTAEKLLKLDEKVEIVNQCNTELEQILYGNDTGGKGYEQGYTEGAKSEYDLFWDNYQKNGTRKTYQYAFGNSVAGFWNNNIFKPKYDMKPTTADYMFGYSQITGDLRELLKVQGVTIDFSKCTSFRYMLNNANITHFPEINLSSATNFTDGLRYAKLIQEVKLTGIKSSVSWSNSFSSCGALKNITFEGEIGPSISLAQSPLNKASIISLMNALSSTATGKTATIKKTAVNNAFETAEGLKDGSTSQEWLDLIATKPNWTISLV